MSIPMAMVLELSPRVTEQGGYNGQYVQNQEQ